MANNEQESTGWKIGSAAFALFLLVGCTRHAAPPVLQPPAVQVVTTRQEDVPIYHEWIANLDGLVNATIRAQVSGYLLTQKYREGDSVKKGDVLFEIDPRPFQAALDEETGVLAQAEARQGKTALDVKRYGPLVSERAISQEDYDNAVQADIEAKAAIVAAKAQVERARLDLGFTQIIAPIDGIAGIAKAQIGDLVGPSTGELATVSTLDPIKAYYSVPEQAYLSFVRRFNNEAARQTGLKQLPVQLILTDGTIYPLPGEVFAGDREIAPDTGAIRLEARFPNPEHSLRPGEFGRVRVRIDTRLGVLLIPQRAVIELQGSYQVAVVDSSETVHIVPVEVGERVGPRWIIEQGLRPGDRVVVEGVQKVRDGISVTVSDFQAP
jgi:RND family efflux transporter MFP subunit